MRKAVQRGHGRRSPHYFPSSDDMVDDFGDNLFLPELGRTKLFRGGDGSGIGLGLGLVLVLGFGVEFRA